MRVGLLVGQYSLPARLSSFPGPRRIGDSHPLFNSTFRPLLRKPRHFSLFCMLRARVRLFTFKLCLVSPSFLIKDRLKLPLLFVSAAGYLLLYLSARCLTAWLYQNFFDVARVVGSEFLIFSHEIMQSKVHGAGKDFLRACNTGCNRS